MTLQKYYRTRWWRDFRQSITIKDDCECEICKRKRWSYYKVGKRKGTRKPKPDLRISIHHKHYNSLHKEDRKDVMSLCSLCHDFFHKLHRLTIINPDVYKETYLDLKAITNWDHEKRR